MHLKRFRSIFIVTVIAVVLCAASLADVRTIRPIFRGPSQEKVVALTFDDGPDPAYTPRILAILKKSGVRATFFVVGENVDRYPDLARRELAEGHMLGNHTFSHPNLTQVPIDQARSEISNCEFAIRRNTGNAPKLFRPPKGFLSVKTIQLISQMNYQPVIWSLAVEHSDAPTPAAMASRVFAKIQPGMIILAHDGRLNRENTVRALPYIISGLKARGYRFITVDEMIELARKSQELEKALGKTSARSVSTEGQSVARRGKEHKNSFATLFHFHL